MSAPFNVTQAVLDATETCEPISFPLEQLTLIVGAACAPIDAIDASEIFCPSYELVAPVATSTCQFLMENVYTLNPNYICGGQCAEVATLAARGLPNEEVAISGSASTLHPFNFTITFASLLVVAFMFFKRSH
ncbi:hypothetical protein BD770DRAFT_424940 [Pilaira anomala]|nr:hypothetical protein BD770DRAFT_424940 [Pilaira anomala]